MWRLKQNDTTGKWHNSKIKMCDHCYNGLLNQYKRHILSFGEDFNGNVFYHFKEILTV